MRALVRPPSAAYADCLREDRATPIDVGRALDQHAACVRALRDAGLDVLTLAPEPDLPDACFVEDTAVIVDGRALLTRPGAPSRRAEVDSIGRALTPLLPVVPMTRGRLDGGDVIVTSAALFAGRSARTDDEGIAEFRRLTGRTVHAVDVGSLLHLKTGATPLGGRVMLARPGLLPAADLEVITVDEPHGATVLAVAGHALVSAAAPRTAALLKGRGFTVHVLDLSEFHKGDAGVTCLSLVF